MDNPQVMNQWEIEDTINYYKSLTDDQKKLILCQIPDNVLWEELYTRDMKRISKIESLEKAMRA